MQILESQFIKKLDKTKLKTILIILVLILTIGGGLWLVNLIRLSLAPPSSGAAGQAAFVLTRVSPAANVIPAVGSTVVIGVQATNTSGVGVAEIVMTYDKAVFSASVGGISENSSQNLLALNKTADNTAGKLTVDIAKSGTGDFAASTNLVEVSFTVLSQPSTPSVIRMATASTLGYPNQINPTTGYGTIQIAFSQAASSVAATSKASSAAVSSAATTGSASYLLAKISPSGAAASGQQVVVGIYANITTTAKGGSITLKFDPTVLSVVSPSEQAGVLALNKVVDNTNGKVSLDIAKSGPGDLAANTFLVQFTFTVKPTNLSTTLIRVGTESKLGVPDTLSASGYGSLSVALATTATSSAATTHTSTPSGNGTTATSKKSSTPTQNNSSVAGGGNSTAATSSEDVFGSVSSIDDGFLDGLTSSEESSFDSSSSEEPDFFSSEPATATETSGASSSVTAGENGAGSDLFSIIIDFIQRSPQIVLILVAIMAFISGMVTMYLWKNFGKGVRNNATFPDQI